MLILGLTGSLAMGKSTVAAMFAEQGVAVFDADRAVHDLYRQAAAPLIEAAFPGTTANGAVDRAALAARVVGDAAAMAKLEAIVHPLVRQAENDFQARAAAGGHRVALLDIPLLLETGGDDRVDVIVVVTAREEIQRQRLRDREGLNADRLTALMARQMPDAEKRTRAHFIIDTSGDFAATRTQVADVLRAVAGMAAGR
jgi:dephospho-CoA kinase